MKQHLCFDKQVMHWTHRRMSPYEKAKERSADRIWLNFRWLPWEFVFGDIGTNPLYAIREAFHGKYGITATPNNILGVLSLIFWSLIIIVTIKYLMFILNADNNGEGGVIALTALLHQEKKRKNKSSLFQVTIGLFAASLLYGDGMITPAISVLSAVEGIQMITQTPKLSLPSIPGTDIGMSFHSRWL